MVFTSELLNHRWLRWGLIASVWTMLGVFDASQTYAYQAYAGHPIAWWQALGLGLAEWYTWAILALPIFWLGRRFPLGQGRWLGSLLVHIPASVFFAVIELLLDLPTFQWLASGVEPSPFSGSVLLLFVTARFGPHVGIYWAVLTVQHVFDFYQRNRERQLRTSQLEARLARARLEALRMQLQPHFLFNTLNAITVLMRTDVDLAEQMIEHLAELLRAALECRSQEVPLARELAILQHYLAIQQARFGPRLTVAVEIEPAAKVAQVPALILQPLVENAIRHGIGPRPGPGRIEIRGRRVQDLLELEVYDDGVGLPGDSLREGIGLSNTRARLEQLYGAGQRLEVRARDGQGVAAIVTLPFHTKERREASLPDRG